VTCAQMLYTNRAQSHRTVQTFFTVILRTVADSSQMSLQMKLGW